LNFLKNYQSNLDQRNIKEIEDLKHYLDFTIKNTELLDAVYSNTIVKIENIKDELLKERKKLNKEIEDFYNSINISQFDIKQNECKPDIFSKIIELSKDYSFDFFSRKKNDDILISFFAEPYFQKEIEKLFLEQENLISIKNNNFDLDLLRLYV